MRLVTKKKNFVRILVWTTEILDGEKFSLKTPDRPACPVRGEFFIVFSGPSSYIFLKFGLNHHLSIRTRSNYDDFWS